jgi:hypothetical protein
MMEGMARRHDGLGTDEKHEHPWRGIDLEVYESHLSDGDVGQLQMLHRITGEQIADHPSRTVGVLGVAGGNGLDLIDPAGTDAVYGYDVNPQYLAACETRYRPLLGSRLSLVEASIDRTVVIEPVELLIAKIFSSSTSGPRSSPRSLR